MRRILWTQEEIETLTRLWPDESATMIAGLLGKTRNAIIGQANRLGLDRKGSSPIPGPRKTMATRVPYKSRPQAPKAPEQSSGTSEPVPLITATAFQCKAVIDHLKDENGLAMVCGKPIVEGQAFSFCSDHLKFFTTRGYNYVGSEPINKQLQ